MSNGPQKGQKGGLMGDPLIAALADVAEQVLQRGLIVTPHGEGWFVRLADNKPENVISKDVEEVFPVMSQGRSW